jgi:hypothetical protein
MAVYDFNICSVDDVQTVSVYRVSALACDEDDNTTNPRYLPCYLDVGDFDFNQTDSQTNI